MVIHKQEVTDYSCEKRFHESQENGKLCGKAHFTLFSGSNYDSMESL